MIRRLLEPTGAVLYVKPHTLTLGEGSYCNLLDAHSPRRNQYTEAIPNQLGSEAALIPILMLIPDRE
jgi:hypothetical protein